MLGSSQRFTYCTGFSSWHISTSHHTTHAHFESPAAVSCPNLGILTSSAAYPYLFFILGTPPVEKYTHINTERPEIFYRSSQSNYVCYQTACKTSKCLLHSKSKRSRSEHKTEHINVTDFELLDDINFRCMNYFT